MNQPRAEPTTPAHGSPLSGREALIRERLEVERLAVRKGRDCGGCRGRKIDK